MARKQTSGNSSRNVVIGLLLLIAAGAIVAFQSDYVRRAFAVPGPSYSEELLSMIGVKGAVKTEDLKLSKSEVRKINFAAMKVRKVFPKVDVSFNMEDKFAPIEVEQDTKLELGMVLRTDDDCEIAFWTRNVTRKRLVPQMVRSMEKAQAEYEHYRKQPELKSGFKRIYM